MDWNTKLKLFFLNNLMNAVLQAFSQVFTRAWEDACQRNTVGTVAQLAITVTYGPAQRRSD